MNVFDWLIVIIPLFLIYGIAVYSKRYVHGMVDYLSAGRVAGRYLMAVSGMETVMGLTLLVAMVEVKYQSGFGFGFWDSLLVPIGCLLSLFGFCSYRFRQTKALSIGQFLEMRYHRSLRFCGGTLRTIAEMLTNSIGPAVAARFLIYFLGIKNEIHIFGFSIPTFLLLVALVLIMAVALLWPSGAIAQIATDCIQGLMSYPIFVIFVVFILTTVSWDNEVVPVLLDRPKGESFCNPFDIESLRDFNLFSTFVVIFSSIINRGSWLGSASETCARSAHEGKMAALLGTWRAGMSFLMVALLGYYVITIMNHRDFADTSRTIRTEISTKVIDEIADSQEIRDKLTKKINEIPPQVHRIGVDKPLSTTSNLDTVYFSTIQEQLKNEPRGNELFQRFRAFYKQTMLAITAKNVFPHGMLGLFCLMMITMMLSTDDSRIYASARTIMQDSILPFLKRQPSPKEHIRLIRLCMCGVALFFFFASAFLAQLDYINMYTVIMTAIWTGGAGPVIVFGLYTRWGTTTGAYCSLITGSGIAVMGTVLQRKWATVVYPFLESMGWTDRCAQILETVSGPFSPYIVWKMNPHKCPINSYEIFFIAMILGISAYVLGSLLTYRKPYNLDRLFHRGIYAEPGTKELRVSWSFKTLFTKLIGITPEYTFGDKILAWSVFGFVIVYRFFLYFVVVSIWNFISPWPNQWWCNFLYITSIVIAGIIGSVSSVWFAIGGFRDLKRFFHDLNLREDNPLDNGSVSGNVSLADQKGFENIDKQEGH